MRIEALRFKKEDKTEVKIIIGFISEWHTQNRWRVVDVLYRPYRKRNFISLIDELSDDFRYRGMSYTEKDKAKEKALIDFVGMDKIEEACMSAWEGLKPDVNTLFGERGK